MHSLAYIITAFYLLKNYGICSEILKTTPTMSSKNLHNEEKLYLKSTQSSIQKGVNYDSSKFFQPIPLITDPLFEDDVRNISSAKELNRKRDIPDSGFTHENKMMLLQLHNIYRGNVTPPAGNMAYMEWDDELARIAQLWSDGCIFDHGLPDNDYPDHIGQNLYIGSDRTGYLGLEMWFEERHFYDMRKNYCLPGKQCGHYMQMNWYLSNKLGCGVTKCGIRYLITCHYSPQAVSGSLIYQVAKPCSQCPSTKGSLCLRNLCMTWEQCKNNPFDCQFAECNLECLNCGHLNKEKCSCECADGWDSPDCSFLCVDKNKRCGMSPGWPNKASCSMNNYSVANNFCRKMCNRCNGVNISISDNICCNGELCDDGFFLDTHENSCKCKLLCPGPLCDGDEEGMYQAALSRSNIIYLKSCLTYLVLFFASYQKIFNFF